MFRRDILDKIELFLDTNDILLFYGARQVGKTTLMKYIKQNYFPNNSVYFDLEKKSNIELLNKDPDIFFEYLKLYHGWNGIDRFVVFIDEFQYLEYPTKLLKYLYDNYNNLKLIVSGSSTLEIIGKLQDSLAGRLVRFEIYPLSFREFLLFKGKENLLNFIGSKVDIDHINEELKFYFEEFMLFGAYPKVVLANNKIIKEEYLKQIVFSYIQKDIKDIGNIKYVDKFNKLLKVLSNQIGSLINLSEISNSIDISIKTLKEWLLLLENTFVIKFIYPFSNNLKTEITKTPKLFFIDTGLRNIIFEKFEISGQLFENSLFSYLNNGYLYKKLNFYRTIDKKEIDFIIDGVPYEVKLNYNGKKLTSLDYFEKKYGKNGKVITLRKPKDSKYEVLYPWELDLKFIF